MSSLSHQQVKVGQYDSVKIMPNTSNYVCDCLFGKNCRNRRRCGSNSYLMVFIQVNLMFLLVIYQKSKVIFGNKNSTKFQYLCRIPFHCISSPGPTGSLIYSTLNPYSLRSISTTWL